MKSVNSTLVVLALIAGTTLLLADGSEKPTGTSDGDFSLYPGSVFDVPTPPAVRDNLSSPGDRPLPGRAHPEAPPQVPHAVSPFLPVTRDSNACVDCHLLDEKEEGEPTPIPQSHYIDFRNAPDQVGEELAGARWVCLSCHVAKTEAEPLVGNPLSSRTEPRPKTAP